MLCQSNQDLRILTIGKYRLHLSMLIKVSRLAALTKYLCIDHNLTQVFFILSANIAFGICVSEKIMGFVNFLGRCAVVDDHTERLTGCCRISEYIVVNCDIIYIWAYPYMVRFTIEKFFHRLTASILI